MDDDGTQVSSGDTSGTIVSGVIVRGLSRADGKQEIISSKSARQTFKSFSRLDAQTSIEKNIVTLTKNIPAAGGSVGSTQRILAPTGSSFVKLSEILATLDPKIETLVIEDTNLLMDTDYTGRPLAIAVIRKKASKGTYANDILSGNILIAPSVQNIHHVAIYAHGGLISVKENGLFFTDNTSETERDAVLSKQLYIKGILFINNTIGGSLASGGKYLLSGNKPVALTNKNLKQAIQYDLYALRRGTFDFLKAFKSEYVDGIAYSTIIDYDESVKNLTILQSQ